MKTLAETTPAVQIAGILDTLRRHTLNAAIIGAAGIGKTCAVTAIASRAPLTHMVTASDNLSRDTRRLWQLIANALGFLAEGTASDTDYMLSQHSFPGHVLIVDEAQQLLPKQLRAILTLWDRCSLSICFCGNPDVLQRSRGRQLGWEQIESRLDIVHHLKGLNDSDADALSELHGVRGQDALSMMRAIGERFHARGIAHVLEATRRTIGDSAPIDAAAIRATMALLPKYRVAIKPKVLR